MVDARNLATASRDQLEAQWRASYATAPPKGLSRRLLVYAAAYNAQAQVQGSLPAATQKRLLKIAVQRTTPKIADAPERTLSPGTRLVREWHGRLHTVDVLTTGFRYDGQLYRSLSEVARTITGARWSGWRFFRI
ncbi:MAG: DUF2924 domain-containing protein [Sphingomonadales bacterium]